MSGVPRAPLPAWFAGFDATPGASKSATAWDGRLKDFWNDPRRWDGIADPHRQMFWEKRSRDVIDVRSGK